MIEAGMHLFLLPASWLQMSPRPQLAQHRSFFAGARVDRNCAQQQMFRFRNSIATRGRARALASCVHAGRTPASSLKAPGSEALCVLMVASTPR
jgi:hypothetical protein